MVLRRQFRLVFGRAVGKEELAHLLLRGHGGEESVDGLLPGVGLGYRLRLDRRGRGGGRCAHILRRLGGGGAPRQKEDG